MMTLIQATFIARQVGLNSPPLSNQSLHAAKQHATPLCVMRCLSIAQRAPYQLLQYSMCRYN